MARKRLVKLPQEVPQEVRAGTRPFARPREAVAVGDPEALRWPSDNRRAARRRANPFRGARVHVVARPARGSRFGSTPGDAFTSAKPTSREVELIAIKDPFTLVDLHFLQILTSARRAASTLRIDTKIARTSSCDQISRLQGARYGLVTSELASGSPITSSCAASQRILRPVFQAMFIRWPGLVAK